MEKLFEYFLENENLHVKYACGKPARKDTEFHDYNEFVYYIKGDSYIISKNIQQNLKPESIVMIPRENYHQFVISKPEKYTRCIIGFRDIPELNELINEIMYTIKIIYPPDKSIIDIFEKLMEIITSKLDDKEKLIFAKASLIQLLIRVKQAIPKLEEQYIQHSTVVSAALDIIDTKYNEKLSVESLAKLLYVSPSTLSHKFKDELNISVYQYITKKRLSVAHKLICQGEALTSASIKCGFNDYSCFYRLYKKYYGNV